MTATLSGILFAISLLLGCPGDQPFLNVLRENGINYVSPEWAIGNAHQVCGALDTGMLPEDLAESVMRDSNLDGYHAGFFVGASIAAYCPQWAK